MEKKTGNTLKLGVFVTLGVLFFIIGIYFIGQKQHMFSHVFKISGVFKNVGGLLVGNNVRFSGINVGTVENIEIINDTSVRVDMIIDESTHRFIKKDAKAVIGSEGLMGNKIISISHGTPGQKEIAENATIQTTQPIDTDEIFAKLKTTSDNAAAITGDLAIIMQNVSHGKGTIGKLFMDTVMAKTLDQTITNLKKGTKGLEDNMDAAKHSFLLRGAFKKEKKDKENEKKEKEKSK
ncbi:MAG: MCE family protein [Bacteroidetes bacterium]|nr:MCE family protein [Bacteroidota bacterium]